MKDEQFLLFKKPTSEFDALWESIEKLKASHDKVRKRLFSEVSDLKSQIIKVRAENERLKFHTEMKPTLLWTA